MPNVHSLPVGFKSSPSPSSGGGQGQSWPPWVVALSVASGLVIGGAVFYYIFYGTSEEGKRPKKAKKAVDNKACKLSYFLKSLISSEVELPNKSAFLAIIHS